MSFRVRLRATVGELALDVSLAGDDGPVALIGPNGAGKTTLLRWIAGYPFDRAAGELVIDDEEIVGASARVPPEARRVGYVPQGYGLFGHLRVIDNVAFGLAARGAGRAERHRRARSVLEALRCGHLADRHPNGLSGGEQQKVALARALAIEPRLLLLDEPMAALDASARRRMRAFLGEQLAASETAAIVVAHDARDVRALASAVAVMERGRIVQTGTPEELAASPSSDFVAEFFDVEPS